MVRPNGMSGTYYYHIVFFCLDRWETVFFPIPEAAHDTVHPMHANLQIEPSSAGQIEAGEIRRFGPDGVLYEIKRKSADGRLLIRVLDTGEETLYPLEDPRG